MYDLRRAWFQRGWFSNNNVVASRVFVATVLFAMLF